MRAHFHENATDSGFSKVQLNSLHIRNISSQQRIYILYISIYLKHAVSQKVNEKAALPENFKPKL